MRAIPFTGSSLIDLLHIRSYPGAFLGFRRRINFIISTEVKGSIGGVIWKGECRYSVISATILEEWGLNTLYTCLANSLAFSIGLRAHPPCGQRIRGIICGKRVSFLKPSIVSSWSQLWGQIGEIFLKTVIFIFFDDLG